MAERLTLDLELVEKVGGPAKRAAAELRRVQEQAKKTQDSLSFGGQTQKIADQLKKLKADPSGYKALLEARKKLSQAQIAAGKPAWLERGVDAFTDRLKGAVAAVAIGGLLIEGMSAAIGLLKSGVKMAFSEGIGYEQLKLSYKLALGKEAPGALADINRFAGQTGMDDDEIAKAMRPLFLAGLRGQGARSAFAAAQDLAAANGSGSNPQDFVDLITKIQLKGGISEKMLVGLGLNGKDFKAALSKETGLSKEAAMAQASDGKMDPQHILNALYSAIEARQGGKLGSGGDAYGKTMGAQIHLLEQLPGNFLKKIADSDAWPKLTTQVAGILKSLDPDGPQGQKIIASLMGAFDRLANIAAQVLLPQNIDKFTAAVSGAVETLAKVPALFKVLIDNSELIVPAIGLIGVSVATMAGPIVMVGAALASVAAAMSSISTTVEQLGGWKRVVKDAADWTAQGFGVGAPAVSRGRDSVREQLAPEAPRGVAGRGPVNLGGVAVNVYPAKGDVEHTGRAVAAAVTSQMAQARGAERAAQEGGGG